MHTRDQVCEMLNCTLSELRGLHTTGGVPFPKKHGYAYVYTDADLALLRDAMRRRGLPQTPEVCRLLGISRVVLLGMFARGMPRPVEQYGFQHIWTPDDIQTLRRWIKEGR